MINQIIKLFLSMGIMLAGWSAFGMYEPQREIKNLEADLKIESHILGENGNEHGAPVLFFYNKAEGYCIVPLSEQDMAKLNMEEVQKRPVERVLNFEPGFLEPCRAEIAKTLLDSIDKESNQFAIAASPIIAGAAYIGFCAFADYVTHKRAQDYMINNEPGFGAPARIALGLMCFPVYVLTSMIRWSTD